MVELRKRPAPAEGASSSAATARPAKRGTAATATTTTTTASKKKGKEKEKKKSTAKAPAPDDDDDEEEEEEEEKDKEKEDDGGGDDGAAAKEEDDQDGDHETKADHGDDKAKAAGDVKAAAADDDDDDEEEEEKEEAGDDNDDDDDVVTKLGPDSVGKKIKLSGFGGEVTTHDNKSVAVKDLLQESSKGIVLFTYPRASTPGCTTQVCLFRDSYTPITEAGLSVYGLSTDSEKANTTFVTKQKLPYPLLCDPKASLTGAIGMAKGGKSTTRGVVVIDKQGTVQVWQQAGPQKTLDAVLAYIESAGTGDDN